MTDGDVATMMPIPPGSWGGVRASLGLAGGSACPTKGKSTDTLILGRGSLEIRCGGRGYRVFAGRIPAASDLAGIYEDVGTVLITLSTSSVPSFRFTTSVPDGAAISAIRTSTGDYQFELKFFPPVSST